MSTETHRVLKKRLREPSYEREGSSKRSSPSLAHTRIQPRSTVYLNSEWHHNIPNKSHSLDQASSEARHELETSIQLLELPYEILLAILGFLDIFGLHEPLLAHEKQAFKRDTRSFHRKDVQAARISCSFFKALTDDPSLWASHLLLRSNCVSLFGMSSMSPFRHEETTLKHVTTLLIVVEDSLSSIRENKELLQFLFSGSCIQHLAIIRRTSAAETFVRTPVISELTPSELMVMHFCEETTLLKKLRRLTLTNVLIRPSLLKILYHKCTSFSQLEVAWSNVTLPSFERRKMPIKNESLLLSVEPKSRPNSAPTNILPVKHPLHTAITAHISPEARLLLETEVGVDLAFSQIELSGAASLMFGKPFIHPGLQYLHLDFSPIAEHHEWERFQIGLSLIPTSCPSLVSFGIILGHLTKSSHLELGNIISDLQTPHLTALYSDLSISVDLIPKLVNWVSSVPKLQIIDLRFTSTRSRTQTPNGTSLKHAIQQSPSSAYPSPSALPFSISVANPAPFPGFSPMIASPNFMLMGSGASPLAGLFSNASTASSAPKSTKSPTSSLLNALSQHCKHIMKIRLTSTENIEIDEDWTGLSFPSLTYLKYNIGKLPSNAFAACRAQFPKLNHLDLAHCEMSGDSAFQGLDLSVGLKYLRIEDCSVNITDAFMPFFESKEACTRLVQLDLRVRRPHGIDAILLQRIAHSCPLLRRFAFSVSQASISTSSAVSLRPFTTLVSKCPSLRVVQCPDRSIFTPMVNDLLSRHSVSVK